jgi:hypothetical protein
MQEVQGPRPRIRPMWSATIRASPHGPPRATSGHWPHLLISAPARRGSARCLPVACDPVVARASNPECRVQQRQARVVVQDGVGQAGSDRQSQCSPVGWTRDAAHCAHGISLARILRRCIVQVTCLVAGQQLQEQRIAVPLDLSAWRGGNMELLIQREAIEVDEGR